MNIHHEKLQVQQTKYKTWCFWWALHVGCYNSPLPTQDLVPRSKHEKARDTQNGDDLQAPTLPPSPSDVPLHLQELDGLVASLALGRLKNTDRWSFYSMISQFSRLVLEFETT